MAYRVIPPYIPRKIIAHSSGYQQEQARRTLTHVQASDDGTLAKADRGENGCERPCG